jgi:molybdopterin-guanine dinucleotide biosynthesis protein A
VPSFSQTTLTLLAGGKATRLDGVPKGLIRVEGRTVVERLVALAPGFGGALLVGDDLSAYDGVWPAAWPKVADVAPGKGPLGGLVAAMRTSRTPWLCGLACDMPFVTRAALEQLLGAPSEEPLARCYQAGDRLHPFPGLYRCSLAERWSDLVNEGPALHRLLAECGAQVLPEARLRAIDSDLRSLANLNTAREVAAAGGTLPT